MRLRASATVTAPCDAKLITKIPPPSPVARMTERSTAHFDRGGLVRCWRICQTRITRGNHQRMTGRAFLHDPGWMRIHELTVANGCGHHIAGGT